MTMRKVSFIFDPEFEVNTSLRDILLVVADLDFQQKFINETTTANTADMAPVNCLKFSYLGTTRIVICDLDARYEQIQTLVAKTFRLPDECIPAIQFTDGKSYHFNKQIFEYFILLFPQPEQKFFVRLELSKIIENRIACKQGKRAPFGLIKDTNKRTHDDMLDAAGGQVVSAPLRRSNCFLGALPDNDGIVEEEILEASQQQPKKRIRLMKSTRKVRRSILKMANSKRALRL